MTGDSAWTAAPAAAPDRARREVLLSALAAACAAGIVLVGLALKPDPRGFGTHEQLGLPPCMFCLLTGLPCPTCGFTTALARMARLDLAGAFAASPAGTLAFLCACFVLVRSLLFLPRGRGDRRLLACLRSGRFWAAVIAVCVGSWAFKLAAAVAGLQGFR
jgi:hypothetical protein